MTGEGLLGEPKRYEISAVDGNTLFIGDTPIRTAEQFLKSRQWDEIRRGYVADRAEIRERFRREAEEIRRKFADGELQPWTKARLERELRERKTQAILDAGDRRGQAAIESLFTKDDPNSTIRKQLREAAKKHPNKDVRKAADLMGRVVDSLEYKLEKEVLEFKKTTGRPGYHSGTNIAEISRKRYEDKSVYALTTHEMAHWIEFGMPELKKGMWELYGKITEGPPLPLPKEGEFYRRATIPVPEKYYTLDNGSRVEYMIATKYKKDSDQEKDRIRRINKPVIESTELLSGFFQELTQNPKRLTTQYPEFFNLIMEILR